MIKITRTRNILLLLIPFGMILSCNKNELPEVQITQPTFYLKGILNGIAKSYSAGINNYYMYSNYNTNGVNGVNTYSGELKEFNCTNCKSYFRISFIDYKSSSGGVTDKDSTFYNGYYNYASLTGTASRYVVYDSAFSLGQLPNYNWSLGNNSTSTSQFAVSTYTQPGKYNTCLNVQFAGACSSSLCNTFNLGNTGPSIEVDIGFLPPAGNTFNFTAQANSGTPPFSYNWNLGDGTILSTKTITHTYSMAGSYQVTLTITDAKGVSATRKQNVRTQGSTDCITTFISSVIPVSNPDNLGNIVIEWIDENKIVYSTLQGAQSNESYFQVLSIEQYEPNGLGQPIKKIKAKLNCVLHNGATSIELKNAEVVFAIATN